MKVFLVHASAPREVHEIELELPEGSRAADALAVSGWTQRFPGIEGMGMSIWSRRIGADAVLRDGDRLEFSRPLRVDPKVARRERFAGQGARTAGLFASRRPGSKAGY